MTKILIVDDDVDILQIIDVAIEDMDVSTFLMNSPQDALSAMEKDVYDILITDMKMPDITGIELIKKAKEKNPDIVSIVVTGYSSVKDIVKATQSGAFAYVTKPFKFKEFKQTIEKAIEYHKTLKENIHLNKTLNLYKTLIALNKRESPEDLIDTLLEFLRDEFAVGDVFIYLLKEDSILGKNIDILPGKEILNNMNKFLKDHKEGVIIHKKDIKEGNIEDMMLLPLYYGNVYMGMAIFVSQKASRKFSNGDMKKAEMLISVMAMRLFLCLFYENRKNSIPVSLDIARLSAIGEIFPSMLHKINNPITTISVSLENLYRSKKKITKDFIQTVENSVEETQKTADILNKLYSRAKTKELMHIGDIIEDIMSIFSYYLNKHRINISVNLDTNLPPIVIDYGNIAILFAIILIAYGEEGRKKISLSSSLVEKDDKKNILIHFKENIDKENNPWLDVFYFLIQQMKADIIDFEIDKENGIKIFFPLPIISA